MITDASKIIRLGLFLRTAEDSYWLSPYLLKCGYVPVRPAIWCNMKTGTSYVLTLDMRTGEWYLEQGDLPKLGKAAICTPPPILS
jgi:hypothetical protein